MFNKVALIKVWNRFLLSFKDGDYPAIFRKFISAGLLFLGFVCAMPIVIILWVLKPIFWLKVGSLSGARIGHLSLDTDLFLRRRQLGIYPDEPFYFFICDPTNLSNRQLLIMLKRVLPICESRSLFLVFLGIRPILKKTPFYQDLPIRADEYYEFHNAKPSLYFTPDEKEKGRDLLNQMNIDFGKDEFVCIFARDDAYLKDFDPHNNWDYHNSRNSDIDSLIPAAKYLIEQGYVVIRIGSIVNKPISFTHEKMIDYPYSSYKNEFLDIFLVAHCKFILSGGLSGICSAATIFDTPILTVNLAECGYLPFTKNCLYTPKKYKYSKTGEYLRFKDAVKLGTFWYNPAAMGLEIEEANPQDILEATQEMLARVEGRFKYSPDSEKLIQAYHKLWEESEVYGNHVKTPIGISWLKKNQDLYGITTKNVDL